RAACAFASKDFLVALDTWVLLGFASKEGAIAPLGGSMPHCTKCGTMVGDGVAFCPNCGAPQTAAASGGAMATSAGSGTSGMSENVAGLLCYVLGWITGLIFYLIDKRPFVRFHAAQSIGLSIALFAVYLEIG